MNSLRIVSILSCFATNVFVWMPIRCDSGVMLLVCNDGSSFYLWPVFLTTSFVLFYFFFFLPFYCFISFFLVSTMFTVISPSHCWSCRPHVTPLALPLAFKEEHLLIIWSTANQPSHSFNLNTKIQQRHIFMVRMIQLT